MLIREATPDDVSAIVELWAQNGLGSDPEINRSEIATRLSVNDDYFLVGVEGDEVIASAMGCYDGHRGHVKRVAITPGRHGQKLGQMMMAELEQRFVRSGVTHLRLQVWSDNERGGHFWEAAGWTELEEIRYFTKELSASDLDARDLS